MLKKPFTEKRKNIMNLIVKGDITFEEAEMILAGLVLEQFGKQEISALEAAELLSQIR